MNPVILLFLRVGLVAVGWLALSAQAAPVLPSSLDVGKSNRNTFLKLCYWHSEREELCFGIRFFFLNVIWSTKTNNNTKDDE